MYSIAVQSGTPDISFGFAIDTSSTATRTVQHFVFTSHLPSAAVTDSRVPSEKLSEEAASAGIHTAEPTDASLTLARPALEEAAPPASAGGAPVLATIV